jgi:microcystin-dependent protein
MANYEATKYDFDGGNITGLVGISTGSVIPWSDTSVPSGFLECNGADVSRTTYASLFAIIGTTYGSGNGSTTFTLPDAQDKIVMGRSPTKALASTGGANTVANGGNAGGNAGNTSISIPTMASHSHPAGNAKRSQINNFTSNSTGGGTIIGNPSNSSNAGGSGAHNHPVSANFTGSANSVLQPYLTVIYIIKT